MKDIKQIRELQETLSENVESGSEIRKLTTLVRSGLFDPSKLTMLKRALNKDNVKMSKAEREALLELLDRLLNIVLSNQGTYNKVKQAISEETDLEGYEELNEASMKASKANMNVDINEIPAIIIMKRRGIRVFPDGQKVVLYYADRINKYISVPFQSIGIGSDQLHEAVASTDDKKKKSYGNRINPREKGLSPEYSSAIRQKNRETQKNAANLLRTARQSSAKTGMQVGRKITKDTGNPLYGIAAALGGAAGTAINKKFSSGPKLAAIKQKVLDKRKTYSTQEPSKTPNITAAAKKANAPGVSKAAGSEALMKNMRIKEAYMAKLNALREEKQLDENPAIAIAAGAARLAPVVARAAPAVGRALVSGGKNVLRYGKKALRGLGRSLKKTGAPDVNIGSSSSDNGKSDSDDFKRDSIKGQAAFGGKEIQGKDPFAAKHVGSSAETERARRIQTAVNRGFTGRSQAVSENKLNSLKTISETEDTYALQYQDGDVKVSGKMATKLLEVYNSLNADNKTLVQEMINKDKESFTKFANFALGK